ncbi:hypothetical protein Y032_0152g2862 [Ancylostoma ceylanicum]|uniref:Uncharacterized protein n=1 Tax=Ancylostoma ceylanicum TaxID=53326 RepID=A0A016T0E5_9BILA|nr:hypothetical protein Y032_0152g2862 [Ancylostoma ceylanicum]
MGNLPFLPTVYHRFTNGITSEPGVLTAGASPERSMWRAVTQIMLAGLFRAIILVYTGYFYGVVKKCYRRRMAETEEQQRSAVTSEDAKKLQ